MGEFSRVYKADLTDRQFMAFWRLVCDAGRDRAFSYCLPPMDGSGFVRWMRKEDIFPWIVLYQDVPVGMVLLTDKFGKSAQVHFCTLPTGGRRTTDRKMGISKAAGLFSLGSILWEENGSGGYVLDYLVGITPKPNVAAVKYALALGGDFCGVVPGQCWFHDTNENSDAVITSFTRKNVPAWTAKL